MNFFEWVEQVRFSYGFLAKWIADIETIDGNKIYDFSNVAFEYVLFMVLTVAVGYFVGSLNFGIIISKLKHKDDVRKYGSGNAGATNMLRTYGKASAALTLLLDILKAAIVTFAGMLLGGESFGYLAGLGCILGHVYPIYYHFKGGKGVACVSAIMLVLEPIPALICLFVFVLTVVWTKYVSLGSIFAATLLPVFVNGLYGQLHYPGKTDILPPPIVAIVTVFIAVFVVYLHRKNIQRIMNKTESKISFKKKNQKDDKEQ